MIKEEINTLIKKYDEQYEQLEREIPRIVKGRELYKRTENVLAILRTMSTIYMGMIGANLVIIMSRSDYSDGAFLSMIIESALLILTVAGMTKVIPIVRSHIVSKYRPDRPTGWLEFYKTAKQFIELMRQEREVFIDKDESPQVLRARFLEIGDNAGGMEGRAVLTAKDGTPFMTSMYGNGRPSSRSEITRGIRIDGLDNMKNVPDFREIEAPYIKVTLFPTDPNGGWTYLLPNTAQKDEAINTLSDICDLIVCDALNKQLRMGITDQGIIDTQAEGVPMTDIQSHFKGEDLPEEIQEMFKEFDKMLSKNSEALKMICIKE